MRWLVLGVLLAGCSRQDAAVQVDLGACSGSIPLPCSTTCDYPVCPDPPPDSARVLTIIAQHCTVCHSQDGVEPHRPFDTYAAIQHQAGSMLDSMMRCVMPTPTDTFDQLSPDDRELVKAWLVCGVPDGGSLP